MARIGRRLEGREQVGRGQQQWDGGAGRQTTAGSPASCMARTICLTLTNSPLANWGKCGISQDSLLKCVSTQTRYMACCCCCCPQAAGAAAKRSKGAAAIRTAAAVLPAPLRRPQAAAAAGPAPPLHPQIRRPAGSPAAAVDPRAAPAGAPRAAGTPAPRPAPPALPLVRSAAAVGRSPQARTPPAGRLPGVEALGAGAGGGSGGNRLGLRRVHKRWTKDETLHLIELVQQVGGQEGVYGRGLEGLVGRPKGCWQVEGMGGT
jgi:hypothetical protein